MYTSYITSSIYATTNGYFYMGSMLALHPTHPHITLLFPTLMMSIVKISNHSSIK